MLCLVNHHYEGNRFKNRVFRSDREKAKYLQEQEEFERLMKEQKEKEMAAVEDEQIARTLQEEEANHAHQINMREAEDAKLAQRLQEKEKERIRRRRLQKELLQVEKIRLEKFGSANPHLLQAVSRTIADIERREEEPCSSSACGGFDPDESLGDLSEFCMKPPENMTEAEMRVFQAEQDEELARFLQQYEAKSKASTSREKKQFMEAQDYEIARILQEEERIRVRKLKEKRRQRARQASAMTESSVKTVFVDYETHPPPHDVIRYHRSVPAPSDQNSETVSTSRSPVSNEYSQSRIDESGICETGSEIMVEDQGDTASESSNVPTRRALPPIPTFHNVAMDLDPTYKRKSKSKAKEKTKDKSSAVKQESTEASSSSTTDLTGIHFAQFCRVTPSPTKVQTSGKNATLPKTSKSSKRESRDNDSDTYPDYDNNTLPAILPVQGQRRTFTVEKRKQKTKDHCRTQ